MDKKLEVCTKKRTRKMLKYFRNKRVLIRYDFDSSVGISWIREDVLKYDSFEFMGCNEYFHCIFKWKSDVFEQDLDSRWEFTGVGRLQYCDGPYSYFSIRRVSLFYSLFHKISILLGYRESI